MRTTYDITSPKFRRDGTELPVATPPDVTERWKSRNRRGVTSDLRLPDLPVGRDATSAYVIDHSSGRRNGGNRDLSLLRVPVAD